ncbi:TIGR03089 family protein [Cellulomonas sp. HZM]|uniref:TIGR03089 family protein n=1 Tax=Cellulomonas sp. HZM TaxID=1454010 RepID=UPI000B17E9C9|nr:TIGR03089 family protein [Cellulomonas sp. HZM]
MIAAAVPSSAAALLDLLARDPGRPRITWYGDDGERVELSGAVLGNWVSKTTNLLVEELDVAPGHRVLIDLPPHWRTLVWALATWRAGACVVVAGDADVVVTTRPSEHRGDVVAVSLPALARRFDGDLPPGALDAAASVMTYGDVVGWVPPADPGAPALEGVAHAELAAWWAPFVPGRRLLVEAGEDVAAFLQTVARELAADGSVVALSPGRSSTLHQDPAALARLLDGERAVVGTP